MKQRLEEFGLRRYGSAAAGPRVVYCCCMLMMGLVLLIVLWQGTPIGAPLGVVIPAGAGLVVQELVGLVRRRRG